MTPRHFRIILTRKINFENIKTPELIKKETRLKNVMACLWGKKLNREKKYKYNGIESARHLFEERDGAFFFFFKVATVSHSIRSFHSFPLSPPKIFSGEKG